MSADRRLTIGLVRERIYKFVEDVELHRPPYANFVYQSMIDTAEAIGARRGLGISPELRDGLVRKVINLLFQQKLFDQKADDLIEESKLFEERHAKIDRSPITYLPSERLSVADTKRFVIRSVSDVAVGYRRQANLEKKIKQGILFLPKRIRKCFLELNAVGR